MNVYGLDEKLAQLIKSHDIKFRCWQALGGH